MADWFARQYADIRGNLKWAFIVALWWIFSSFGKKMLSLIPNIPQWLVYIISFLVSLAAFVWMAKLIARSKPADKSASESKLEPPGKTWGDLMAEEDAENIQERVVEITQRREFHFDQKSEPYLAVITELYNGSVFDLVSEGRVSGHVTYAGNQLAADPRVVPEPVHVRMKHGHRAILTVKQYLSSPMADTMQANRDRGVSIDFQSVAVSFTMRSPVGPSQTYRWFGPRFTIEETTRV